MPRIINDAMRTPCSVIQTFIHVLDVSTNIHCIEMQTTCRKFHFTGRNGMFKILLLRSRQGPSIFHINRLDEFTFHRLPWHGRCPFWGHRDRGYFYRHWFYIFEISNDDESSSRLLFSLLKDINSNFVNRFLPEKHNQNTPNLISYSEFWTPFIRRLQHFHAYTIYWLRPDGVRCVQWNIFALLHVYRKCHPSCWLLSININIKWYREKWDIDLDHHQSSDRICTFSQNTRIHACLGEYEIDTCVGYLLFIGLTGILSCGGITI